MYYYIILCVIMYVLPQTFRLLIVTQSFIHSTSGGLKPILSPMNQIWKFIETSQQI